MAKHHEDHPEYGEIDDGSSLPRTSTAGLRARAKMVRRKLNDGGSCARHLELAAAEIERLRVALTKIAVVRCVGIARDGGEWPNGFLCQICDSVSSEGETLQHMLTCPLVA